MKTGLIGYTGFVGGNLLSAIDFDLKYNSSNIEEIKGLQFKHLICAGVKAQKWWANQHADEDWVGIQRLMTNLEKVTADIFTLISTIDVYPNPVHVMERDIPDTQHPQPYGRHRLLLEQFCAQHFPTCHIIRLPGLFGRGLKKNAIFDLLNNNNIFMIPSNGYFQWYPIRRLSRDMLLVEEYGLPLLNIAVEPISMGEIVSKFFPNISLSVGAGNAPFYDMHTLYPEVLGGKGNYHLNREQVFEELDAYIKSERVK